MSSDDDIPPDDSSSSPPPLRAPARTSAKDAVEKPPAEIIDPAPDAGSVQRQNQLKKREQARMRAVLNTQIEDFEAEEFEEQGTGQILTKAQRGKRLKADRAAARKALYKRLGYLAGFGVLIWALVFLLTPFKEGLTYGVCKVFLEQQVRYPEHLRYSEVEEIGGNSVRIWFRQVGPYGEHRMESMRCYFRYPEDGEEIKYGNVPFVMSRVTRNRREYYPDRVDAFNRSMTAVLAHPPSLVFPEDLSDSLSGLRFNVRAFRKVRL